MTRNTYDSELQWQQCSEFQNQFRSYASSWAPANNLRDVGNDTLFISGAYSHATRIVDLVINETGARLGGIPASLDLHTCTEAHKDFISISQQKYTSSSSAIVSAAASIALTVPVHLTSTVDCTSDEFPCDHSGLCKHCHHQQLHPLPAQCAAAICGRFRPWLKRASIECRWAAHSLIFKSINAHKEIPLMLGTPQSHGFSLVHNPNRPSKLIIMPCTSLEFMNKYGAPL